MDSHWFSYSTYVGPGETAGGNGCMISVVLDDESGLHFSGIRLLVVYKPSKQLDHLSVTQCLDMTRFGIQPGTRTSYRQALIRQSGASQYDNKISTGVVRPACTVIFELIDISDDRYYCHALVPHSLSEVERLEHVRVAYDHAYPCTRTNPSILLILNTSHPLYRTPIVGFASYNPADVRSGISVHSVRVVPISRRQRQLPTLPPRLLRYIIKLALGGKSKGWRMTLLSYGLVCKSWAHVLDLALGGFDEVEDDHRPGVISVARALDLRPERAACIRIFSPWIYEFYIDPSGRESLDKWQAVLTILTHATSIESLELASVHGSVVHDLVRLLRKLRNVRICRMKFGKPTAKFHRGHPLSMGEVQMCIADWERLESLEVVNWSGYGSEVSAPPQLACKLKNLTLQGGKLSGSQLLRFISSPAPCLKELNLTDVQDIPNCDLLSVLNTVAPTLNRLVILKCTILRATPDEEHAIDAAMPSMNALEQLHAEGDCISARAIAGKPKARPRPGLRVRDSLFIQAADAGMTLGEVAQAMKVTTWEAVDVRWSEVPDWNQALAERTRHAAVERGVTFTCHIGYPFMRP